MNGASIFLLCIFGTLFCCQSNALRFGTAVPFGKTETAGKSSRVLNLTRRYGHRTHEAVHRKSPYTASAFERYMGLDYSFEILWGDRSLSVEIDTGSSDLWVAHSNFTCLNQNGKTTYRDYCGFGEYVEKSFEDGQIIDDNFYIQYGTGTIYGTVGFEDITLAGLEVKHQEVAIGYRGYWDGDNVTAGLMGLAYPSITDAYAGTRYSNDTPSNFRQYLPWFFTAFHRGLISPMFSMALQRSANNEYAGQLAFGGLPDASSSQEFTSVPIKVQVGQQDGRNDSHARDFYAIDIDGLVVDNIFLPENGTDRRYIVDSGTPQIDVTTSIAAKIVSKFSPPANNSGGQWQVSCTPKSIPKVAVRIAGVDFPIDPRDLVQAAAAGDYQRQTGYCLSSIQGGGGILGDPFLKNVVAVFDVGAAEMRFAPHVY